MFQIQKFSVILKGQFLIILLDQMEHGKNFIYILVDFKKKKISGAKTSKKIFN